MSEIWVRIVAGQDAGDLIRVSRADADQLVAKRLAEHCEQPTEEQLRAWSIQTGEAPAAPEDGELERPERR